ncbi:hypothetical protein NDU88_004671 [Pleurodeles waltl]|uniref:Uncharacterized protein n=1 Tax=Pleurodeles waltl TaxID=8319 RepID=A0AAV7SJI0_PLEWA|nr:hypothetical protein NDU88_004671 [Pleurodeles waltl]
MLLTSRPRQLLKHIQGHSPRNNMLIRHLELPPAKLGPAAHQSTLARETEPLESRAGSFISVVATDIFIRATNKPSQAACQAAPCPGAVISTEMRVECVGAFYNIYDIIARLTVLRYTRVLAENKNNAPAPRLYTPSAEVDHAVSKYSL